jgi:hypothetical protein
MKTKDRVNKLRSRLVVSFGITSLTNQRSFPRSLSSAEAGERESSP